MTFEQMIALQKEGKTVCNIDGVETVIEGEWNLVPWCLHCDHRYHGVHYNSPLGTVESECKCGRPRTGHYRNLTTGQLYHFSGFGDAACGNYSTMIYETVQEV